MKKQIVSAFLIVALTLAGCSSGKTTSEGNAGAAAAPSKTGGTLVIARLSDANNLDPHYSNQNESNSIVLHKVYEGLVLLDKSNNFKPLLATEWKQLNDVTWEFKLRQGVAFHDGTPFNAEAVRKTVMRVLDKNQPTSKAQNFKMISEVKVIDDYTVQLVLNYPYAPLLSLLASVEGSIFSPAAIDKYGKELSKNPVGTGPFRFESWTPGQEIVLAQNDKYWGNKAKISKAVFKVVPEDTTRIAMVETGEAQVAEQLPITEIERINASSTMNVGRFDAYRVDYIGFNTKKKPFDDPRVRQAISYAVDRESIVKGVFNNVGKLTNSILGRDVFGYSSKVAGYPYDLNKAKQLLAEAGYPNGFKTTVFVSNDKQRVNVAEVLQSQLKGIGIELQLNVMEFGAYLDAAVKGQTEMFVSSWANATGDADYSQFQLFHSSSFGQPGNHTFYSNKDVDQLIESGGRESDPERRKQIYEKIQEIENRDAVVIPLRSTESLAAISKKVEGVWISPSGYIEINDVTMK
ncbi:glutathione ABC transporter substrate-binding protein [Paenibacillus thalictri]|uniref:Glutathione ABC transporter substrate-binding protein n=1 Tax=Paenibacillus thalictri TaxID=2527873 RepID=A0A4Q9DLL7_9BACL|nr:glutathione ABC transporter substrate-binding protein [Paenibacillus thalictri]TBL73318.1 glutathione ABC transporter substrate-binding protein [Paenibacillus thalictri]